MFIKGIEEICFFEYYFYVSKKIDGVLFQFQFMLGMEVFVEMNIYIFSEKFLCIVENCMVIQYNFYMFRGVKVRDVVVWVRYL